MTYDHTIPIVAVVVFVLTLTHRCNAVRGHRTGSDNSVAEDYLRKKTNKRQKIIYPITETNCRQIVHLRQKKKVKSAYVSRYIPGVCHMLNESQQKPKPRRQHSTHRKRTARNKRCPNRNRKREGREKEKIQ